jgi:hypothetical protein
LGWKKDEEGEKERTRMMIRIGFFVEARDDLRYFST